MNTFTEQIQAMETRLAKVNAALDQNQRSMELSCTIYDLLKESNELIVDLSEAYVTTDDQVELARQAHLLGNLQYRVAVASHRNLH